MYARMLEAYMVQPDITRATTAHLNWVNYKFLIKTQYISLVAVKTASKSFNLHKWVFEHILSYINKQF